MADKFQRSMKWPGLDDTYYFLPLVSEADNGKVMTVKDGEWAAGDEQASFDTEAYGETIILDDAADRPLRGLRVLGKTTQNGTPTPDAPVPLVSVGDDGAVDVTVAGANLITYPYVSVSKTTSGLTYTVNADGSVSIKGTATEASQFVFVDTGTTFADLGITGAATLSCVTRGTLGFVFSDGTSINVEPNTPRVTVTPNGKTFRIRWLSRAGVTYDETLYPMLNLGTAPLPWEPYKPAQTLTLSTPNGLPSVGDVCDEIDLERGVYVQRVKKTRLTSTVQQWRQSSSLSTRYTWDYREGIKGAVPMCSHYPCKATGAISETNVLVNNGGTQIYVNTTFATLDEWKAWLDANDVWLAYVLATPIETPLSEEEIAAYKALKTHYPTTTIFNDESAEMVVEYVNKNNFDADAVLFRKQTLTDAQKAQILDNIGASSRLQVHDVSVTTSLWVDSTLHADYPYQALIPVNGATREMCPDVVFNVTEALSGNYAPVADAANGGVLIYAKVVPEADIVVPTVTLWK